MQSIGKIGVLLAGALLGLVMSLALIPEQAVASIINDPETIVAAVVEHVLYISGMISEFIETIL